MSKILTPDQLKQWAAFKTELQKDIAQDAASGKLQDLQKPLKLTSAQVTQLQPAMTTAIMGKIDEVMKLANARRIGLREKMSAKHSMEHINSDLEKAMAGVLTPDQMQQYKAMEEKSKKS